MPLPCDADGDFDLVVSCPDEPSNGIYLFENATGDTSRDPFPVFRPARRIGGAVLNVMPSYVAGRMRVLTPGHEHLDVLARGLAARTTLPIPPRFHRPTGSQTKGPQLRHNQWRYVDYDGDGDQITGEVQWLKNVGPLAGRDIEGHDASPTVVDFDGDGAPDFLGGAEDGRLYFIANPRAADRAESR